MEASPELKIRKYLHYKGLGFGTSFVPYISDHNEQVLFKILPYNMLTAITSYKRFFLVFSGLQVLLQKFKNEKAPATGGFFYCIALKAHGWRSSYQYRSPLSEERLFAVAVDILEEPDIGARGGIGAVYSPIPSVCPAM